MYSSQDVGQDERENKGLWRHNADHDASWYLGEPCFIRVSFTQTGETLDSDYHDAKWHQMAARLIHGEGHFTHSQYTPNMVEIRHLSPTKRHVYQQLQQCSEHDHKLCPFAGIFARLLDGEAEYHVNQADDDDEKCKQSTPGQPVVINMGCGLGEGRIIRSQ